MLRLFEKSMVRRRVDTCARERSITRYKKTYVHL